MADDRRRNWHCSNFRGESMANEKSPSDLITEYIESLPDWRGRMLVKLRKLILDSSPELAEEWKWDTPVWSHKGNVVAAGVFSDHVKLNFFKGASLKDPKKLFNAGLEAKASRGIDLFEKDKVDAAALKELIREAVEFNQTG